MIDMQEKKLKSLKLTQGYEATIDNEDYERVNQYKWYYHHTGYAVSTLPRINGKQKTLSLSRFIMNASKGIQVDHINMNTLDNRKENLRLCNMSENQRNVPKRSFNRSGYKGVSFHKVSQKWRSRITINSKTIYLGIFETKEDAALAYNKAAIKYHGEFARLNEEKNV
jgi:hypothetical protein